MQSVSVREGDSIREDVLLGDSDSMPVDGRLCRSSDMRGLTGASARRRHEEDGRSAQQT